MTMKAWELGKMAWKALGANKLRSSSDDLRNHYWHLFDHQRDDRDFCSPDVD